MDTIKDKQKRDDFTEWIAMIIRSYDTEENSYAFVQMVGGLEALIKHQQGQIEKLNGVIHKFYKESKEKTSKVKKQ